MRAFQFLSLATIAAIMAMGCGGGDGGSPVADTPTPGAPAGINEAQLAQQLASIPKAPAGEPVMLSSMDASGEYLKIANNQGVGRRLDPFSLLVGEAKFEKSQQGERLTVDLGSWSDLAYQAPPPVPDEAELPVEPQPRRRLAGVLLGEGASALIEMEDGKIYDIRPGSKVGEWTVLSIDANKAVLYRDNGKRPKEVAVYMDGSLGGGGGQQPAGGGDQPGGRPGEGRGDGSGGRPGEIF